MYDQFYGLQGRPFQLTPDPHYYFESATHRKALSYLGYGLAQGEGFIVITGDIGAGKTTLVGHLMQTIDPSRLTAVKIVSTQVQGDDMLRLAAQSFGLATEGMTKAATLQQVEAYLHMQARAGRRTLLIVDEAQNLAVSAIEELRMLSNFQLGGQSLLQIFLLGQPEFRDLLKSPQLEQLRQRVIATHHLEPMMANEVEPYVIHRLTVAGWDGRPIFSRDAFAALYAATGGVPRRLNALVSRVLLMGAIEQLEAIDADVVQAVVADMGLDIDVTPTAMTPSALDDVEDVGEDTALIVPEAEAEADVADDTAQLELETVEEADEIVAEVEEEQDMIDESWPLASDTQDAEIVDEAIEEEPIALEDSLAQGDATLGDFTSPYDQQDWSMQRAPFAPPVEVDVVDEDDDQPEADLAEALDARIADLHEAEAEQPDTIDAQSVEMLRHDMLGEIEALRAEIASLRAVQAHVPFVPAQTIDPEALKDCFTLIEERLSSLEFRAEEQDTALRRVLTLLVDWVEREDRMAGVTQDSVAA
ncbi:putative secretion ATPase (PEP-CTERM system associated) [Sphingobium xenophagum]|uniref:Secretion ATPase (PEP-CTERM system associated) n=1 Tax=Sphingobium xenophagum TaxID=121428 RepID=A0ABU1WZT7_SPHXE|nr:XrtA/PEP-CTERM system-associated ATPase [Sphingobium xenophagum]MDR7154462.1 putative secretion ATPase (PEP-CTERM system associated) [Sphingobium xenophagum]